LYRHIARTYKDISIVECGETVNEHVRCWHSVSTGTGRSFHLCMTHGHCLHAQLWLNVASSLVVGTAHQLKCTTRCWFRDSMAAASV
jgi:hypothetical protein